MAKFCTNCGSEIKPGAKFCENCGQKLEQEQKPQEGVGGIAAAAGGWCSRFCFRCRYKL